MKSECPTCSRTNQVTSMNLPATLLAVNIRHSLWFVVGVMSDSIACQSMLLFFFSKKEKDLASQKF